MVFSTSIASRETSSFRDVQISPQNATGERMFVVFLVFSFPLCQKNVQEIAVARFFQSDVTHRRTQFLHVGKKSVTVVSAMTQNTSHFVCSEKTFVSSLHHKKILDQQIWISVDSDDCSVHVSEFVKPE